MSSVGLAPGLSFVLLLWGLLVGSTAAQEEQTQNPPLSAQASSLAVERLLLEDSSSPPTRGIVEPANPDQLGLTAAEAALLDLVNRDRARYELSPVTFDPELLQIARARAAAQVPLTNLSHTDSSGQLALGYLLAQAEVPYRLAGENLARVEGREEALAELAEYALMASATHRANILEPAFDRLAVGTAGADSGVVIFAQIFLGL